MPWSLKVGIYVDNEYHPETSGGIDAFVVSWVKALAKYAPQHHYTVLAQPRNYELLRETFSKTAVDMHCLNRQPLLPKPVRFVRRKLRLHADGEVAEINRFHFDVVSFPRQRVWISHANLRARTALTLFDIQHEYYPEFFPPAVLALRQENYHASVEKADLVIVSTNYTKQTIAEKMPVFLSKVQQIYPGFAADRPSPTASQVAEVLLKHQLPETFILYPANPWMHKNHARLMAALRLAKEQYQREFPVVFTGRLQVEAPYTIRNLATAAGVEAQVYDLGYIAEDDLAPLYAAARFLIFPSLFEGFGYPVLEAMAQGCPVACANATCLPEVVGDAALLFDPLDVHVIADSILQMWDDDDLRTKLRAKGFERVRFFSWERCVRETTAAYIGLVEGRKRP